MRHVGRTFGKQYSTRMLYNGRVQNARLRWVLSAVGVALLLTLAIAFLQGPRLYARWLMSNLESADYSRASRAFDRLRSLPLTHVRSDLTLLFPALSAFLA